MIGNIYDKEGRLLATSYEDTVLDDLRNDPAFRRASLLGAID
jgi:hypothetical protein